MKQENIRKTSEDNNLMLKNKAKDYSRLVKEEKEAAIRKSEEIANSIVEVKNQIERIEKQNVSVKKDFEEYRNESITRNGRVLAEQNEYLKKNEKAKAAVDENHTAVRLATSWATTKEDLDVSAIMPEHAKSAYAPDTIGRSSE